MVITSESLMGKTGETGKGADPGDEPILPSVVRSFGKSGDPEFDGDANTGEWLLEEAVGTIDLRGAVEFRHVRALERIADALEHIARK